MPVSRTLEKELLAQNAQHGDWECTEKLLTTTHEGSALYMHCLPADITGVSCARGEVEASVFDRYRVPVYKEASYKPYIIAGMIMLSKVKDAAETLRSSSRRPFPGSVKRVRGKHDCLFIKRPEDAVFGR